MGASQQSNPLHNQPNGNQYLQSQIIIRDDDKKSSGNIIMSDRSVKHAPVPQEKKLARKLKDQAKKSSEKLLSLLMKQKIQEITVQDILGFSLGVHKMMFQNLSPELQEDENNNNNVQVTSGSIKELNKDDTGLEGL